jgi:hypothetical protein
MQRVDTAGILFGPNGYEELWNVSIVCKAADNDPEDLR